MSEINYSITTRRIRTESAMTQMLMTTETTMPQRTSPLDSALHRLTAHCTTERAHVVLFLAQFHHTHIWLKFELRPHFHSITMVIHVVVISST